MDTVAEWAERIARRVAPDEIDFAADVGEAYAAGDGARRALFDRPGTEPGGFGPGSAAGELPVVLAALADTGRFIVHALSTQDVGNLVAVASLLVSLRGARRPPADAPDDARTALTRAYVELRDRLRAVGLPPDRAEHLAREILEEMVTDAVGAEDFLRRLDGGRR
ncbi:hypothetical protein AB0L00_22775 [Actinoallomurus sp. NPDC052308]|uniref:hypothetical protein n=1 Tax=Actinoallomurus sp. NPDC052308 TaxID=3155530 RepID=UPI003438F46E